MRSVGTDDPDNGTKSNLVEKGESVQLTVLEQLHTHT